MRFLPIAALATLAVGCQPPPVSPLQGVNPGRIKNILVTGSDGRVGTISNANQIHLILAELQDLRPFKAGKVDADLPVRVVFTDGSALDLRVGPLVLGPAVSPSDVVWRWELRNEATYRRLVTSLSHGATDP